MKPKYEEYLQGSTVWRGRHKGVYYELAHHGVSEYQKEGIWCAYIFLFENECPDFDKFFREDEVTQITENSPYHITNNYWGIPDMGFKGGITYYENKQGWNYKEGKHTRVIKIGCDYNHSWDADAGYPDTLESVREDTVTLIDNYMNAGYKLTLAEAA